MNGKQDWLQQAKILDVQSNSWNPEVLLALTTLKPIGWEVRDAGGRICDGLVFGLIVPVGNGVETVIKCSLARLLTDFGDPANCSYVLALRPAWDPDGAHQGALTAMMVGSNTLRDSSWCTEVDRVRIWWSAQPDTYEEARNDAYAPDSDVRMEGIDLDIDQIIADLDSSRWFDTTDDAQEIEDAQIEAVYDSEAEAAERAVTEELPHLSFGGSVPDLRLGEDYDVDLDFGEPAAPAP